MKKNTLLLIFLINFPAFAQVIPSSNRVDWSVAGSLENLPAFTDTVNILNYGGTGSGTLDNTTAINNAIAALAGNPGVIYFPAGVYLFNSPISLPAGTVLKGNCADSSILKFNLATPSNCINIAQAQSGTFVSLVSGFFKDSTLITLADASSLNLGDYAEIRQQNGSWDTQPASWAENSVGQIVKITNISGNVITLAHPLRITLDASLNPEIRKVEMIQHVGIEDLIIERTASATSGYTINFSYAANCWVKGVELNKSAGAHIGIEAGTHVKISGCYIHHAYAYDGSSTRGYGVMLYHHTGECLVENNIFRYLRHAMMVKQGANGNVFGYNYSIEPNRAEYPSNAGGDISLHGHYPFSNLFEGNIVQNIHTDQAWGPSGPFNTFLRNRAELYGIIMSGGSVESDEQNYIGNEVTNTGLFMGNYTLFGSGHVTHGNNIKGTINPSGTGILTDTSYYRNSFSDFWNALPYPPVIGPPNSISTGTIPAKERYQNGGKLTVCSNDSQTNTSNATSNTTPPLLIYPNPFTDDFYIDQPDYKGNTRITLYDYTGREVINREFKGEEKIKVNGTLLPKGMYLIEIPKSNFSTRQPILKN